MASCEKCWRDAGGEWVAYNRLLEARFIAGEACSPEEQAGEGAGWCPECERGTAHELTGRCVLCGLQAQPDLQRRPFV